MSIRKIVKDTKENGVNFQNVLDSFFMRDDQDSFARSQGWQDAAQMIYYENMAMQEASAQDLVLHELAKVDSREVYNEDDMAGVY